MKNKLLIGIAVVLWITALIYQAVLVGVGLIVVWVCLVWMVRKRKNKIFHE